MNTKSSTQSEGAAARRSPLFEEGCRLPAPERGIHPAGTCARDLSVGPFHRPTAGGPYAGSESRPLPATQLSLRSTASSTASWPRRAAGRSEWKKTQ